MKNTLHLLAIGGSLAAALTLTSCGKSDSGSGAAPAAGGAPAASQPAGDLEKIEPKFAKPQFVGTPPPPAKLPNLEEAVGPDKVPKHVMLPKGSVNLALKKPVTSSDPAPIIGDLSLVTDDDTDGSDGCFVELAPGKQWVQIDLEQPGTIHALWVWHYHKQPQVYLDFVAQISDDPEFKAGVTTVYNADHDNTSELGAGTDKAYTETNHGRLIPVNGVKGRYVRLWSNGNTTNEMNHYVEVAVYGVPAK
jgi:hypothetical protein